MGGREVGGLSNMLANHLDIENADHRASVQEFWNSPTICTQAGLKAVDLFQACAEGKIKALWVMSTNPAVSMPDADGVAAAIKNVPFVVTSDIMAQTDTGDLSDVLLPAAGWGEKNGAVTNSERRVSRQRAFLSTPGEARPDWRIISDVAAKMGFADAFQFQTAGDVFAEYVALNQSLGQHGRDLDLSGFDGVDYEAMTPTQWPANNVRFFADGQFYHADGKAKMLPVKAPAPVEKGLSLNTGRNRDQWHTMSRTGKAPRLGAHLAEPYAEMHPQDANEYGADSGDLVKLTSAHGTAILRALVTDRATQGQIFAPMHWTRQIARGGTVNSLTAPVTDPFSGQPALKSGAISAELYDAKWFGYLATIARPELITPYGAIARTQTGWQMEMAGDALPDDWVDTACQITGFKASGIAQQSDEASGIVRIGFYAEGQLQALFFAAPTPVVVSRGVAIAHVGTDVSPLIALAGRTAADQPDPGPTVCACFNVGRNTILDAISQGAGTVPAIGDKTCAGTNCGSCKPELAALLAQSSLPMAAE